MSANTNPLIGTMPGDTIDHLRDALAVVAAALAAPWEARPQRTDMGLIKLLGKVDGALAALAWEVAQDPAESTSPDA